MSAPFKMPEPGQWPIAGTRCNFRGREMDYETVAFLLAMEAELGYTLTIAQGCYSTAVAASGNTHAGGGTIDLAPWDFERKVKVARSLGAAAWHRTELWRNGVRIWPEHIHFVIRKHPTLSGAAAEQVMFFDQKPRKNGLAGEPVDPNQFPPRPTPTFRYPPKAPPTPTFRAVSLNDDWANLASDVPATVEAVRPLAAGVQEGWRVKYRSVVPKRWGVKQRLESKASAGVAVLWDRRRLARLGSSSNPSKRGRGLQVIGKGEDTRDRPVVWRDLKFKPGVNRGALPPAFRLASVHYPPMRDKKAWAKFDATLALWLKRSPLPVLLLTDSNHHGGPSDLLDSLHSRFEWHGVGEGIDGAITDLPVKGTRELPKGSSDHHAVVVALG